LAEERRSPSNATHRSGEYGYNRLAEGNAPVPVRDLMLSAEVTLGRGSGEFAVEMTDGRQVFACVFDAGLRKVRLTVDGDETPVRTADWPPELDDGPATIEMSLFDRQVLVAVGDRLLFPPWSIPGAGGSLRNPRPDAADPPDPSNESAQKRTPPPSTPVRFGAWGVQATIGSLQLYRDVHYTRGRARNGVNAPCQLGDDEYFMLGDNSPVSSDSRNWPRGAVPHHLLLGKPFLVHLPSRPGEIRIGDRRKQFRIPDFARVRYIR
jgi:hypothetical protein